MKPLGWAIVDNDDAPELYCVVYANLMTREDAATLKESDPSFADDTLAAVLPVAEYDLIRAVSEALVKIRWQVESAEDSGWWLGAVLGIREVLNDLTDAGLGPGGGE